MRNPVKTSLLHLRPSQEPALLRRLPQRVRQSPQSGYDRKRWSDLGLRVWQNKEFTLLRRLAQVLKLRSLIKPVASPKPIRTKNTRGVSHPRLLVEFLEAVNDFSTRVVRWA